MVDQSTINQPKLTPEEELDVLEAVYRIGKEKGLDLLRPEQIHKLTEAGRLTSKDAKTVNITNNLSLLVELAIREAVVNRAIDEMGYCSRDEWEMKNKETKLLLENVFLFTLLKVRPEDIRELLMKIFTEE